MPGIVLEASIEATNKHASQEGVSYIAKDAALARTIAESEGGLFFSDSVQKKAFDSFCRYGKCDGSGDATTTARVMTRSNLTFPSSKVITPRDRGNLYGGG